MKRGTLTLKHHYREGEKGAISVYIELADGTVWLTKQEICEFFLVTLQAVNTNMTYIFKSREVNECEVTRYENGVMFYNLDLIIALAYRMRGGYCRHFREWITQHVVKGFTASQRVPIYIRMSGGNDYIEN